MTTKIRIRGSGPIRIEGEDFELLDSEDKPYDLGGRTAISLCRCSQSKNLPFCDGTHGSCGFDSKVVATVLPPKK